VSPYDQAIATFQKPASGSSSHYVIRSSDGQVTQMVPTKDVAWHAGNWTMNEHSIGIEHEGIATQGGTWYTEQMYRASADLVRYLAAKYHIPLDRRRILATRTSRGNARATSRPRTGIRVPTGTGRTTGTCRARR
jgi:N-acetyl-anhydromuramyl-L-alanine amidase AmpD